MRSERKKVERETEEMKDLQGDVTGRRVKQKKKKRRDAEKEEKKERKR